MDVTAQSPAQRRAYNAAYLLMLVVLPAIPWYVTIAIRHYDGALVVPSAEMLSHIEAPTLGSTLFYVAWLALQIAFAVLLPGRVIPGERLENGTSLDYRLNGLSSLVLTVVGALGLSYAGVLPATFFYDQLGPIVTTANVFVLLMCFAMVTIGRRQATPKELLLNPLEAYFVGAALNPRTGPLDWKFFSESRPGMILWVLMNLSFAAAQYQKHGEVSNAMVLVCLFQILYVTDYFVLEDAILTTWDIRHEPFGFMLCWGCLVWIPFTFSLQALYLVDHPGDLSVPYAAAIFVLNMAGYAIFRGSNLQKHQFRKNPGTSKIWGKPAQYIETSRGTKLLVSGFWGLSRHSNYLGDLMMGLAWCLTTGFSRVLPYFYIIYFVILLVHRERRDNDHCARKYGKDWETYTAKVPWRILPFVY
jgi:delta14-sterol reductase